MDFPDLVPTARSFTPGNYAVKKFNAMNGVEHRMLYGNVRTQMTLSLTYSNIKDEEASKFMEHFDKMAGTFLGFSLPVAGQGAKAGYKGDFKMNVENGQWRYEEPPQLKSVFPGISTVTVKLRGVH